MNEVERRWQIILPRQVEKTLYRLPKPLLQQMDQALLTLAEHPHLPESHRISGYDDLYRLPVEEWRLTYAVAEERLTVLVLEIAPKQQPERYRLEEELDEAPSTHNFLAPPERTEALLVNLEKFREEHLDDFYRTAFGNLVKQAHQEKIRLLIVDHLPETRENLRKLVFGEPDVEVVGTATNGEEAIQMTVERQPSIVLMDTNLPGTDGFAACEQISQQLPSTLVIMMSAWGTDDYVRRAMLAGAKEFLIKPFSSDELMTSIRRVYQSAAFQKSPTQPTVPYLRDVFTDLKMRLREKLLAELDPTLDVSRPDEMQPIIQDLFDRILAQENIILSRSERERLFEDVLAEIFSSVDQLGSTRREKQVIGPQNEAEAGLDESQIKATALWFKFYKLGKSVEISLSVTNMPKSLDFYQELGFEKVDGGEKPYQWAVVSDGQLYFGLHQREFSSPTLSYFGLGILSERTVHLPKLGVRLDYIQKLEPIQGVQNSELLCGMKFMTAEFESPEGQRVLLADRSSDVETTPSSRRFFSKYEAFGELSLRTEDVKAAVTFWEQLGFVCVAQGNQPYPWAVVSDGLIRLGFHQTSKLTKPTITYFAPDMPDRLKRFRQRGIKFLAEHKDKKGRRVGAVIESPDGQPFFLFTGEVKSPQKEAKAVEANVSSQAGQEVWTHEESRPQPDGAQWYLIYSHSGNELKVRQNLLHRVTVMGLQDKIFQVVVPPDPSVMLRISGSSFLSGSLLVQMAMDEDTWYVVNNTPGVTGFVGASGKPTPLPPAEVDKLLRHLETEETRTNDGFKVGQKVRIVEGPFEDFIGIIDEVDPDQAKIRVRVSFFGQEKSVRLDFSQVERI